MPGLTTAQVSPEVEQGIGGMVLPRFRQQPLEQEGRFPGPGCKGKRSWISRPSNIELVPTCGRRSRRE